MSNENAPATSATPLRGRRGQPSAPAAGPVHVAADAAWSQVIDGGAEVALLGGRVWLTFENDGQDHVLEAPATYVAPFPGRVAVWAFSDATLAVSPAPEHKLAA